MTPLSHTDTLKTLAKLLGKPCMYIIGWDNPNYPYVGAYEAAPYMAEDGFNQMLCDGSGFLVFDSEEEMYRYYDQTVGDDGPTKSNPYDGPVRIYALTCGADGQTQSENT